MSSSAIGLVADTSAFKKLAASFRAAAPKSYRAAQKELRAVALEVYADAKGRSSFSSKISSSGRVRMSGLNAKIAFGGGEAYFAAAVENRGAGDIMHPVFSKKGSPRYDDKSEWTNKNSHAAFLHPAFDAHVMEYVEALAEAVREATEMALRG